MSNANMQYSMVVYISFYQVDCSSIIDHAGKIIKANHLDDSKSFICCIELYDTINFL